MISIKNELMEQLSQVEMLLQEVEKRQRSYKNLEPGSLRVTKSNGCPQYHLIQPGKDKEIYIPTYEKNKIHMLAQRDYDKKAYKTLLSMDKRLKKFITGYNTDALDNIYEIMCDTRKELVIPVAPTEAMFIEEWLEEHKGNVNTYGEATEFKTRRGEYVRSKSEKIIADYLLEQGIPYQYEPRFEVVGSRSVFPDFVILNVRKRKTIYWEHLGRVGDMGYATRNFSKLMDYEEQGLILGDNLIITLETLERQLDIRLVEEKVNLFLK
jgi:hypothetical protein